MAIMTPLEKAERAKQLNNDPLVRHIFEDIRMNLVHKLEHAPISDHETQHEIALMLQLLKQVRDCLVQYAQEIEVDKHRQRQDSFVERMRQRLTP